MSDEPMPFGMTREPMALVDIAAPATTSHADARAVASRALGLRSVDVRTLRAPIAEREFVLLDEYGNGVLPRSVVGFLAAKGGTGKTWALVDLAVSLCCGVPWLGWWPVEKGLTGKVALVLCEETQDEVVRRVQCALAMRFRDPIALSEAQGKVSDRLRIAALPTVTTSQVYLALQDAGCEFDAVLLDPFARFAEGEAETDAAAATLAVRALELLTTLPGAPVVLVASHTRKAGGGPGGNQDAMRGQSALVDGARWVALLESHMTKKGTRRVTRMGSPLARLVVVKANHVRWLPVVDVVTDVEHGGAMRKASPDEVKKLKRDRAADNREKGRRGKAPATGTTVEPVVVDPVGRSGPV